MECNKFQHVLLSIFSMTGDLLKEVYLVYADSHVVAGRGRLLKEESSSCVRRCACPRQLGGAAEILSPLCLSQTGELANRQGTPGLLKHVTQVLKSDSTSRPPHGSATRETSGSEARYHIPQPHTRVSCLRFDTKNPWSTAYWVGDDMPLPACKYSIPLHW